MTDKTTWKYEFLTPVPEADSAEVACVDENGRPVRITFSRAEDAEQWRTMIAAIREEKGYENAYLKLELVEDHGRLEHRLGANESDG